MARKRVISRTAFIYNGKITVANMETMQFEKLDYEIKSIPELTEKELTETLKKEYGESIKIDSVEKTEILLVMPETQYIELATVEEARKKYNDSEN